MTVQRTRFPACWTFVIALVSMGGPMAAPDEGKLTEGVELPLLESVALSGEAVTLPQAARGHGLIIVFSFTKASQQVTRPWTEGCWASAGATQDPPSVHCYDARMLEEVPRLFRGMVERAMKSDLPEKLMPRTLLVYTANDLWRQRLGVTDSKTAYVIGCDQEGRVR